MEETMKERTFSNMKKEMESIPVRFLGTERNRDGLSDSEDASAIELSRRSMDYEMMEDVLKRTFKDSEAAKNFLTKTVPK